MTPIATQNVLRSHACEQYKFSWLRGCYVLVMIERTNETISLVLSTYKRFLVGKCYNDISLFCECSIKRNIVFEILLTKLKYFVLVIYTWQLHMALTLHQNYPMKIWYELCIDSVVMKFWIKAINTGDFLCIGINKTKSCIQHDSKSWVHAIFRMEHVTLAIINVIIILVLWL